MDEIRSRVRAFIVNEFLQGEHSPELRDDTPLRASGVVDSLGTLRLISFVEEAFAFEVDPHDATADNFGTIGAIVAYVARRKAPPSS